MNYKMEIGNYRFEKELGHGSFGRVFLAWDHVSSCYFAVKVVPKRCLLSKNLVMTRLFNTEYTLMSVIRHPNVIPLFELLESPSNFYLVMPFCEGGNLHSYISAHGPLPEAKAVEYLRDIRDGFVAIHEFKAIHRDIKLDNIFLKQGRAVIGDLGLASLGLEKDCLRLGSRATMAPEVFFRWPCRVYDNKIDLWSIGICLFQMLFARLPDWLDKQDLFSRQQYRRLVKKSSGANLKTPTGRGISEGLLELLRRLLTFQPKKRITWEQFNNHHIFFTCEETAELLVKEANGSEKLVNNDLLALQWRDSKELQTNTHVTIIPATKLGERESKAACSLQKLQVFDSANINSFSHICFHQPYNSDAKPPIGRPVEPEELRRQISNQIGLALKIVKRLLKVTQGLPRSACQIKQNMYFCAFALLKALADASKDSCKKWGNRLGSGAARVACTSANEPTMSLINQLLDQCRELIAEETALEPDFITLEPLETWLAHINLREMFFSNFYGRILRSVRCLYHFNKLAATQRKSIKISLRAWLAFIRALFLPRRPGRAFEAASAVPCSAKKPGDPSNSELYTRCGF